MPSDTQPAKNERRAKPDHLKRTGGAFLVFFSAIGAAATLPLWLVGGAIGFLAGAIARKNVLAAGLLGAKIGSLGWISAFLHGIKLLHATVKVKTDNPAEPLISKNESKDSENSEIPATENAEKSEKKSQAEPDNAQPGVYFFKQTVDKPESKAVGKPDFSDVATLKALLAKASALAGDEPRVKLQDEDNLPRVD